MAISWSLGGLLGPLAPAAPLIGAALAYKGAQDRNVASAQAAKKQMSFQRTMSDTSYQRQIADLKAAGINPMLVSRLGGASTPMGAMPQFENVGLAASQGFQQGGAGVSSAAAAEEAMSRIPSHIETAKKIAEEIKNIPLEGERIKEATYMLWSQAKLMHEQGATQRQTVEHLKAAIEKLNAETGLLKNQAAAEEALDNLGRNVKQLQPVIDVMKPFIGR